MGKRYHNGLISGDYLIAGYKDTIFNNDLAVVIGIQKAVVLQNIHGASKEAERAATQGYTDGFAFGQWWCICTWDAMRKRTPYWTVDEIKATVYQLQEAKLISLLTVGDEIYMAVNYDTLAALMDEDA